MIIGETTVLVTGKRGNGKSLWAIGAMKREIAAGRPTFAANFNGLRVPGVQTLDNPREWESLPTGSILFVDEAQRFWRSRRTGDPPPEVQAMETQRHMGITIVLLTQQPTYLDKHIRGLVDVHHHLVLEVGGKASRMYTWSKRCMEEPDEPASRELAEFSVFVFPPADFGSYDSAELHTIKPKIPRRLKLIAMALPLLAGLIWFAMDTVGNLGSAEPADGVSGEATTPTADGTRITRVSNASRYDTPAEYLAAMNPRIPEIPWSAPAFDGREIVSDPHVYCIARGTDGIEGCSCFTEQGTRYAMDLDKCLVTARYGEPYNPFKAPEGARSVRRRAESGRGAGEPSPAVEGAPAPAVEANDTGTVEQVARYGGFRSSGS